MKTASEKKEDLSTIKKFYKIFVKKYAKVFPNFEVYQEPQFKDYLGYGAGSIFVSEIKIPEMSEAAKKKAGLQGDSIHGMIWLESDINPNGITGKNDIGRTFVIHVKFTGIGKINQRTFMNDKLFIGFYSYGRDIDSIVNEFDTWVNKWFKQFESDILNKKYHWKNQYKANRGNA